MTMANSIEMVSSTPELDEHIIANEKFQESIAEMWSAWGPTILAFAKQMDQVETAKPEDEQYCNEAFEKFVVRMSSQFASASVFAGYGEYFRDTLGHEEAVKRMLDVLNQKDRAKIADKVEKLVLDCLHSAHMMMHDVEEVWPVNHQIDPRIVNRGQAINGLYLSLVRGKVWGYRCAEHHATGETLEKLVADDG